MKTKAVLLALAASGIAAVTGAVAETPQKPKAPAAVAAAPAASPGVLVYYFHATTRCATCRTIEAYAKETVTSKFASDLEAHRLEWRAVNVDEPANRHFIRDFQLYTRSVVVVDAKDPKHYKVLDRVWQLVRDKAAFQSYVEQEIRAFPRS
jgi:hypothetical protein